MNWSKFIHPRNREYILIGTVICFLIADIFFPQLQFGLLVISIIGSIPTLLEGGASLWQKKISIDVFNLFALVASFASREIRSAAFIVLMLSFARLLNWFTASRTNRAIEELLRLKPAMAERERAGVRQQIDVEKISVGDIIVVTSGGRVPVDGVVTYGTAYLNEASVTGESAVVQKVIGDEMFSGTLVESGVVKFRATRVGKDSTIERMAALVAAASTHKSHSEKLADRFAQIFLPLVGVLGLVTWLVTGNLQMVAALFLVACADDMAVAIPLAFMAAIGTAARHGVIIKGGEWLDALGRTQMIIFDKTGTLTYGELNVRTVEIFPGIDQEKFWRAVAVAEKFSEHPVGKAIFHQAATRMEFVPDPDKFTLYKGVGVRVEIGGEVIYVGNEGLAAQITGAVAEKLHQALANKQAEHRQTAVAVVMGETLAGVITVADVARSEAKRAVAMLRKLGVGRVMMFTGDNAEVAADVAADLGITEVHHSMKPEDKLRELETFEQTTAIAMVGDGINDAPSLARARVGIAMGKGGASVAVEAADVVILTDNLSRIPEMISLSRKTASVVRGDMVIWVLSNLVGFVLVFTGIAGPALAAFYNFTTDFLPLINSTRLFGRARER